MNKAAINAGADAKAIRNIGRIKTLITAIAKAKSRGNTERAAALKEELDRRMESARSLKKTLDELDGIDS